MWSNWLQRFRNLYITRSELRVSPWYLIPHVTESLNWFPTRSPLMPDTWLFKMIAIFRFSLPCILTLPSSFRSCVLGLRSHSWCLLLFFFQAASASSPSQAPSSSSPATPISSSSTSSYKVPNRKSHWSRSSKATRKLLQLSPLPLPQLEGIFSPQTMEAALKESRLGRCVAMWVLGREPGWMQSVLTHFTWKFHLFQGGVINGKCYNNRPGESHPEFLNGTDLVVVDWDRQW